MASSSDNKIVIDDPYLASNLLRRWGWKRSLRPGQFRFRTLFLTTLVFSVVFAVPRWTGSTYPEYFAFLSVTAFVLAPFFSLIVVTSVRWLRLRSGILLASAVAIVPFLIHKVWVGDTEMLLLVLVGTSIVCWLPQIVCIWGVWYFLFRDVRRWRG